MKRTREHFPEMFEGTIYTVLRRLAADGNLETYDGDASAGPKRKYYRITPSGTVHLSEAVVAWEKLCGVTKSMGLPPREVT
jgi:PadR family transcriptional regulator PadR